MLLWKRQPIFYPLHHQRKFSWVLFPVSSAAKSDLAAQFWPMGHDQKCLQIISAALMLTPSSFPSREETQTCQAIHLWLSRGTAEWCDGRTWARCHETMPQQAQMAPEGLSQTTLDPNISNMKGSLSKRGPYYGTSCKVIYRHWHGEMSEACNDFLNASIRTLYIIWSHFVCKAPHPQHVSWME